MVQPTIGIATINGYGTSYGGPISPICKIGMNAFQITPLVLAGKIMKQELLGRSSENGFGSSLSTVKPKWGSNNELFRSEASKGQHFAEYVALLLKNCDFNASATPLEFAATIKDRERFINEQDIIFDDRPGCIEVKSRDLTFTSQPASFPFNTALVDTQTGWDLKNPKPLAVVIVSQRNYNVLAIKPSTQPTWTIKQSFDRVREINESWYQVNRSSLVTFSNLCTWLRLRSKETF